MGTKGEITLGATEPRVDKTGAVFDGENVIDGLKMARIPSSAGMQSIGHGMYHTKSQPEEISKNDINIRQNYLEMSNVNIMHEMVNLIETMRQFETAQKFMMGLDSVLDKAINVVGEV